MSFTFWEREMASTVFKAGGFTIHPGWAVIIGSFNPIISANLAYIKIIILMKTIIYFGLRFCKTMAYAL